MVNFSKDEPLISKVRADIKQVVDFYYRIPVDLRIVALVSIFAIVITKMAGSW